MNQKGNMKINMPIPAIGGGQQAPFDITQAIKRECVCGHDLFDLAYRIGIISRMAPGNKTGQDVTVKYEVFVCRLCGFELTAKLQ